MFDHSNQQSGTRKFLDRRLARAEKFANYFFIRPTSEHSGVSKAANT